MPNVSEWKRVCTVGASLEVKKLTINPRLGFRRGPLAHDHHDLINTTRDRVTIFAQGIEEG